MWWFLDIFFIHDFTKIEYENTQFIIYKCQNRGYDAFYELYEKHKFLIFKWKYFICGSENIEKLHNKIQKIKNFDKMINKQNNK